MIQILIDDILYGDIIYLNENDCLIVTATRKDLDMICIYGYINSKSEFVEYFYYSGDLVYIKERPTEIKTSFWERIIEYFK